jgi:hypothetical protein
VIASSSTPSSPGFGGTTASGPSEPRALALRRNTPLAVRLRKTFFTAPPVRALPYLKPIEPTGRQPAAGRSNVWSESVPPVVRTRSVAPAMVGLPTMVAALPGPSRPATTTFRFATAPVGSLSRSFVPRIAWSAANPVVRATPERAIASTAT